MARILVPTFALLLAGLPACGGGGSGADLAVVPPPAPPAPVAFTPGVALLADADVDQRAELYVANLDGDGFLKVSGQLVAGGNVTSFAWSPDRALLAFTADKDTDDVVELYVVGAGGGAVTKVSGPLNPGADVFEFKWSPDSTRLAYLADQHMDGFPELFMAAAQGGSSAQVSNTFPVNGSVLAYAWAPDGSRIAYLANQDENAVPEVFSALAAGGGNVQVSGAMVPGGYVSSNGLGGTLVDEAPFAWAADGSRIAYLATQDDATVLELYTSLPAGGGNVKVNAPLAPETLILPQVYAFAWSPDSTRLAYAANQESNLRGEVFTAGPDGSGNTKVFVATWDGGFAMHPTWSSDGERIAGWANNIGFSEGLAFAGPALAPVGPTSVLCEHFAWSPGADALAIAVEEGVGVAPAAEVYGPTGFTPVSSLANGETVSADTLAWAPDGSRVAFCTADLHVSFPTTEYGSERISPTLHGTDRSVRKFQWAPDSLRLVFTADIAAAEKIELFISPRDAASRTVLSPPLVFGGQVLDFEVR